MTADRKALNQWARMAGYNDFDTYIRAGNSILDARKDIAERIGTLQEALTASDTFASQGPRPTTRKSPLEVPKLSDQGDDPTDTANAHPQGDEA